MTKKALLLTGIGIAIGALAGYAYYFYVGCASGTCAITSKPLNSTLYGALMGGLIFNMLVKEKKKVNSYITIVSPLLSVYLVQHPFK